jgi:bifunctional lysine-specific demethylase and histidyl-hydroxylase NO66
VAGLLAAGELKVADLPGLDAADQLTLARRLVTESIATVPGATAEHHGGREHAPGNGS